MRESESERERARDGAGSPAPRNFGHTVWQHGCRAVCARFSARRERSSGPVRTVLKLLVFSRWIGREWVLAWGATGSGGSDSFDVAEVLTSKEGNSTGRSKSITHPQRCQKEGCRSRAGGGDQEARGSDSLTSLYENQKTKQKGLHLLSRVLASELPPPSHSQRSLFPPPLRLSCPSGGEAMPAAHPRCCSSPPRLFSFPAKSPPPAPDHRAATGEEEKESRARFATASSRKWRSKACLWPS